MSKWAQSWNKSIRSLNSYDLRILNKSLSLLLFINLSRSNCKWTGIVDVEVENLLSNCSGWNIGSRTVTGCSSASKAAIPSRSLFLSSSGSKAAIPSRSQ